MERVEYPQKVEKEEGPSTKEEKKEKTGKIQIRLMGYITSAKFHENPRAGQTWNSQRFILE